MTYSSTLAMNRQRFGQRNQNTVSVHQAVRTVGPVSNTIILIVLTCILGLLYLTQVTKTNSYGYQINKLKEDQAQLKSQKTDLEIKAARLQSFERVASSEAAKDLVSVTPSGTIP